MKKRNIFIVGGDDHYINWMKGKRTYNIEDADLVCFTGGEDVSPHIYGKRKHPTTGANIQRDLYEIDYFKKAVELGIPMIGICRGSQFLCAMNGGILCQHQSHPYIHPIKTNDGREFLTTSTHHQRQVISGIPADDVELIAWAEHLSPYSFGENDEDILDEERETEIAFYRKTKSLGIQGHPEFVYPTRDEWQANFIEYCQGLIDKYLGC